AGGARRGSRAAGSASPRARPAAPLPELRPRERAPLLVHHARALPGLRIPPRPGRGGLFPRLSPLESHRRRGRLRRRPPRRDRVDVAEPAVGGHALGRCRPHDRAPPAVPPILQNALDRLRPDLPPFRARGLRPAHRPLSDTCRSVAACPRLDIDAVSTRAPVCPAWRGERRATPWPSSSWPSGSWA